jgi:hypothetical protein
MRLPSRERRGEWRCGWGVLSAVPRPVPLQLYQFSLGELAAQQGANMKRIGQGLFVSLLLYGVAFAYSTGEQTVPVDNVVRFGADPTGLSDSAKAIADAIGAGNRKIKFPCGTYLILSPIRVPDNTDLEGSGPCTVIKSTPTLAFNPQAPQSRPSRSESPDV